MTLLSTISKWGNGQGIRLPKTLLDLLKWENNDKLEIIVEDENIRIKKITPSKKRKNIKELFANYEKEYKTQEIDWGEPEGKEIW
ncbi:AbrB/MazE/SpoVT family DNA-binding domain-containing protein [Fusobacterium simiae]|uniref:AbrB/MazE/SpoVT family DNA-binding domain-containing protein n=1 Tax=Fusobacterium simiae TaxID=855 RepID=A0ABT4DGI7_FUSSI|nr:MULTISPECIES: AbrB/MazE/SpoVT family DNA-binding domain-containing protein [Fusobacterium]MCY7007722.1 AbrB/MazE/SpoVT family DNA-binding domain-containing protein [Fusobacterium simiae]MDC7955967.1 AbrB/MazE/SpoVT family DNA-binding domain-containing protein [Fusobacterium simiae]